VEPDDPQPPACLAVRVDVALAVLALLVAAALGALDLDAPWENGLRGAIGSAYAHRFVQHHVELGLATTRGAPVLYVDPLPPGKLFIYGSHPMTYPLLLLPAAWLLGATELAVRLGALLLWLPAVLLLWRVLRRLLVPPAAGAGALLFASLPMAAYFGPMVNPYGALVSALLLAALLALRAMERPTRGRRVALAAAAAACALLDWPGVFVVPQVLLLALARRERDAWRLALVTAAGLAVGLLLVLLQSAVAQGSLARALSEWLGQFGGTQATDASGWLPAQAAFVWSWCGPAVLGLAGLGAILALVRGGDVRQRLLASLALLLPGLLNVLAFRRHAVVHDFWALFAMPGLALLAALPFEALLARGWTRVRVAVAAAACLLVVGSNGATVLAQVRAARTTEFRDVGEQIQQQFGRGDLVVSSTDLSVSDVYTDATLIGPVLDATAAQRIVARYSPPAFTGRLGFALPRKHRQRPLAAWLEQSFGAPEEAGPLLLWTVR
jgi:hypothetical protein